MKSLISFTTLADHDLLDQTKALAHSERRATAELIGALAEVDSRRLYLGEGYSSLFTYCVQALRLSEHAAYGRIEAARAARRFPVVLDAIASGQLTLTAVTLLAPPLTDDNHERVLASAHGRSKRDVEQIVAALRPRPDVPATIRKLPTPRPLTAASDGDPLAAGPVPVLGGPPAREPDALNPLSPPASGPAAPTVTGTNTVQPTRRSTVTALAPERFKIQFTMNRETHDLLRRAQDLLRHTIPDGDPAQIFERAIRMLVADLARRKTGAADRPRTPRPRTRNTRAIPASVMRVVWARDGGQCAFIGTDGRCGETGFLEYHHVYLYTDGGEATPDNIQLRCQAHNHYEAREAFGPFLFREERSRTYYAGPR